MRLLDRLLFSVHTFCVTNNNTQCRFFWFCFPVQRVRSDRTRMWVCPCFWVCARAHLIFVWIDSGLSIEIQFFLVLNWSAFVLAVQPLAQSSVFHRVALLLSSLVYASYLADAHLFFFCIFSTNTINWNTKTNKIRTIIKSDFIYSNWNPRFKVHQLKGTQTHTRANTYIIQNWSLSSCSSNSHTRSFWLSHRMLWLDSFSVTKSTLFTSK